MAHGYAKIENKPMMIMAHGTVGLQHASMGIYNAYADRVPVYIILGNILDVNYRRGAAEWEHSVQDAAGMVREFVKWDDTPVTLTHFAESAVRAYKIAMTPPMEPVVIVADGQLQEEPITEKVRIPKLVLSGPPMGDSASVMETARILVAAENPVIVVGRAIHSQKGIELLVELAEALQVRVYDQRYRMNFPTHHPLAGRSGNARLTPPITEYDAILALEAEDLWGVLHRSTPINRFGMETRSVMKPGAKLVTVSAIELNHKANYQDFGRYVEADVAVTGDTEATLPELIEAVKKLTTADRRIAFAARGKRVAEENMKAHQRDVEDAALAWDASPVSTARVAAELWAQVKNEDWSLVSNDRHSSCWESRLWNFTKQYQFIGAQGGGGVGYNAPASVGAALANRKHGRLTVSIQDDGDFNYGPAVFWTAAHHSIPILSIMHNNRAYHEERMYIQLYGAKYNRAVDRSDIGTALIKPNIDYAMVAKGYGLYSEGPISNPNDLGPAIARGIERVKKGEPALIDVVTQPR
jgi:acetolactate synthase-1/2/3 large subunit